MGPLKIDIVAPGRFYCFDLAAALIAQGHDVRLLTNYPASVCERWGVPAAHVRSLLPHGIASRVAGRLSSLVAPSRIEPRLMKWFGAWAARTVRPDADIVHVMSGAAEEILRLPRSAPGCPLRQVVRGSTHIRAQFGLLADEERRLGVPVEKPSPWMIAREEREYALADEIVVLSSFARRTFVEQGIDASRLAVMPLGLRTDIFTPGPGGLEERCRRILEGRPLNVLNVGTVSARKGVRDLVEIASSLRERMRFVAVADVTSDARAALAGANGALEIVGRVPEHDLIAKYRSADVFLFPTIEDGFAAVLGQALAAGLPVLATTNCSATDIVRDGVNGWVLPIRSPHSFVERLDWCDRNRDQLARIVRGLAARPAPRTWSDMADDVTRRLTLA